MNAAAPTVLSSPAMTSWWRLTSSLTVAAIFGTRASASEKTSCAVSSVCRSIAALLMCSVLAIGLPGKHSVYVSLNVAHVYHESLHACRS